MGNQIKFTPTMVNGVHTDCAASVAFECGQNVASITLGYKIRKICCGGNISYQQSLVASSNPTDSNDVSGVIITMTDGGSYFIPGVTVDDVQTACNSCCGEVISITVNTETAFANPSASSNYCLSTASTAWSSSSVSYAVGDIRSNGGYNYRCIAAHTSSTSLLTTNATYWEVVSKTDDGSSFFTTQIAQAIYGKYDITYGISRYATNKFNFYSTDVYSTIPVPAGWSISGATCS